MASPHTARRTATAAADDCHVRTRIASVVLIGAAALLVAAPCWGLEPTFVRPAYRVELVPLGLAPGDFDHDGRTDLAVTGWQQGRISILLGDPEEAFLPQLTFSSSPGFAPRAIVTSDLDGDGTLDLAYTAESGPQVVVHRGLGDGSFALHEDVTTGGKPRALAVGDLDADGAPDLAVALWTLPEVAVLVNRGDGTFAVADSVPTGANPAAVAVDDVDGDGTLDLVVANRTADTVEVFRGAGDATFTALAELPSPGGPDALLLARLDGDDALDLVVAHATGDDVTSYLGDGAGGFAAHHRVALPARSRPTAVVAGDVDVDDRIDVVFALEDYGATGVLYGRGDGTFERPLHVGSGDEPVAVALVDVDGYPGEEIATLHSGGPYVTLSVHGVGRGFLSDPAQPGSPFAMSIEAADLDNDGDVDLAGSDLLAPGLHVWPGDGRGGFAPPRYTPFAATLSREALPFDYDLDGTMDLAVCYEESSLTPNRVRLMHGLGDGTFAAEPTELEVGTIALDAVSADFNLDGLPDLAVLSQTDGITPWYGDGAGGFVAGPVESFSGLVDTLQLGDFDDDGFPDLAFISSEVEGIELRLANGDRTFSPRTWLTSQVKFGVAVGDLDGDGLDDATVSRLEGDASSLVTFFGDGTGAVREERVAATALLLAPRRVLDVDDDGRAQVLSITETVDVATFDDAAMLTAVDSYAAAGDQVSFTVGDVDGDGRPDVVTPDRSAERLSVQVNQLDTVDAELACPPDPLTLPAAVELDSTVVNETEVDREVEIELTVMTPPGVEVPLTRQTLALVPDEIRVVPSTIPVPARSQLAGTLKFSLLVTDVTPGLPGDGLMGGDRVEALCLVEATLAP